MRVGVPGGHAIVGHGFADALGLAFHILVCEQRKRRRRALMMASLATLLQDAGHVFGVGYIGFLYPVAGGRERGAHA